MITNSGTAAISCAYFSLGLGPGDEVIVPTYTFAAVVTPLLRIGATPVLADSEGETENASPNSIGEKVTRRTKAIVVTHQFGHPAEMREVNEIAEKKGLAIVEDCAHGLGATYRGRKLGTFGLVSCFSLGTDKIVTGGSGGMLLTNDRRIYERAVLLAYAREKPLKEVKSRRLALYAETGLGENYGIHPLALALIRPQFESLDLIVKARQDRMRHLSSRLRRLRGITPPVERSYVTHAYYGYKPRFNREGLRGVTLDLYIKALQAEGVEIKKPRLSPLHMTPLFKVGYGAALPSRLTYKRSDLPVSASIYDRLLTLPIFTKESLTLVNQYADAFEKVEENAASLRAWRPGQS
jgi:perosamine synthetase